MWTDLPIDTPLNLVDGLPIDTPLNLVDGLPRRGEGVIAAKGGANSILNPPDSDWEGPLKVMCV